MTDTGLSLLAGVLADPRDDAARLVYADWLEERGQPGDRERAEWIRWVVGPPTAAPHTFPAGMRAAVDVVLDGFHTARHTVVIAPRLDRVSYGIHRGFVSHVTCSAADWLAHADALVWRPGQTEPCPVCDGCGGNVGFGPGDDFPCARCGGTSSVPRPVPATAHPITAVTLTTVPQVLFRGRDHYAFLPLPDGRRYARADVGRVEDVGLRAVAVAMLAAEWPGVAFDLPPTPVAEYTPAPVTIG